MDGNEVTLEYPKMLYLHPVDKTQEHKFVTVANCEEEKEAVGKGYKLEPHVPVPADVKDYEQVAYEEAPGSGSQRWYGEGTDWAHTSGAGLTDDTTANQPTHDPAIVAQKADSPKDILEDQHMNDKPDGGKIEN